MLGRLPAPCLDARAMLRHFGDEEDDARRAYARWMFGPDRTETADPVGALHVEGSEPDLADPVRLDPRDDQATRRRGGWDLDRAIRTVSEFAVRAGGRTERVHRAQADIAVVAVHGLGLPQVAGATGVTPEAISKSLLRLAGVQTQIVGRHLAPRLQGMQRRRTAAE